MGPPHCWIKMRKNTQRGIYKVPTPGRHGTNCRWCCCKLLPVTSRSVLTWKSGEASEPWRLQKHRIRFSGFTMDFVPCLSTRCHLTGVCTLAEGIADESDLRAVGYLHHWTMFTVQQVSRSISETIAQSRGQQHCASVRLQSASWLLSWLLPPAVETPPR